MSQAAFHALGDHLRVADVDEQKCNHLWETEVEAGVRSVTIMLHTSAFQG